MTYSDPMTNIPCIIYWGDHFSWSH